ncbi:MAG: RNA 2',3'-cyclic phosphodiesterase [Spirochaetes bacterium]|jgi:2'-5' RNA ligase|nr:RNA 2',3'-cyclic phosphodiesterase [Spirochaetota bacterium]
MTRLFIGLPIDAQMRLALRPAHDALSGHDHILKTVPPENYHITVKFLGECDGNVANAIESTFLEIAVPDVDIPFTLSGMGAFPDMKKPTVIWAGLLAEPGPMSLLFKNVERFASNFRFREEKRQFSPHLTLARLRSGRKITGDLLKFIENNSKTLYGESSFTRLALYSSKLTPEGANYTEIKSISF